jgi:hypothetical protein
MRRADVVARPIHTMYLHVARLNLRQYETNWYLIHGVNMDDNRTPMYWESAIDEDCTRARKRMSVKRAQSLLLLLSLTGMKICDDLLSPMSLFASSA